MENVHIVLRSSILPSVMHRVLWRGSCLAVAGATCLLIPGIFMPPLLMGFWGLPLFLIGMGLIAWGLIPYRKLRKLEDNPYRIAIGEDLKVEFSAQGKPLFTLPAQSIERLSYVENETVYGIAVYLKSPLPEKLAVEDSRFDLAEFRTRSLREQGCDLFFPYFSRRSFETFQESLSELI